MATQSAGVPSLLIPVQQATLLLPNAAVAEIIDYRDPQPISDAPKWLLGMVPWRGLQLPLLSFEAVLHGAPPEASARLRIAVMNTLNGNPDVPFFGIVLQGIPHLVRADEASVTRTDQGDEATPGVLARVDVNGEPAIIPDLDAVEKMLGELRA